MAVIRSISLEIIHKLFHFKMLNLGHFNEINGKFFHHKLKFL